MTLYSATPTGSVPMESLDQANIEAQWAVGAAMALLPTPISIAQQLQWLANPAQGTPYLQQQMAAYQTAYNAQMVNVTAAQQAAALANAAYLAGQPST
jgi:hypothetical protein